MTTHQRENFERAFSARHGTIRGDCACGKEFYEGGSLHFEEGEEDALRADEKAVCLQHGVSYVTFEGRQYVADCDCWLERAARIIGFIENHDHAIAEWLTLEKQRRQLEADHSPVVK